MNIKYLYFTKIALNQLGKQCDRFVCYTGLNPSSNTSGGDTVEIKITLMFSDVPTTELDQVEYFDKLNQAIRSVLSLSMEWYINVSQGDFSEERRLGLTSNVAVSIVFTSLSAGPGDIAVLLSKLDSQAFIDQLNSLGFKASKASPQLTSTSNQAPSPLAVGLCSAAGVLICLTLLFWLAKLFSGSPRDTKSMNDVKSGAIFNDSVVECSLELSADMLDTDNRCAEEAIADCSSIMGEMASNPFRVASGYGAHQINEGDYSKEFDDVLQLIARLEISIKSLVDPHLRKEIEATMQHSNEITPHDCARVR